jgi:MFS family permease
VGSVAAASQTPLRTRNYRLYFSGQLISVPGTWLQTVAQAWLVLQLSGSGGALGVVAALQTLPVLLLSVWAGSVADAVDKRMLLVATQATQGLLALVLGVLTVAGAVQMWMVYLLASGLGMARAFDVPTRQAFVSELVTGEALPRAIGINSTVASAARMIGPAAGGIIIALLGVGACFLVNAATFFGPLVALLAMDTSALYRPARSAVRGPQAMFDGLRYVGARRELLVPLLMMALVGTLAFEFQVTIPLLAHSTFGLGAAGFGLLYAALGFGAVLSGFTLAGKLPRRLSTLVISAAAFGVALGAAALAPSPAVAAVCFALTGAASVVYSSSTNSALQIGADPSMRGRVVALYVAAFVGSTGIGAPLVGLAGQWLGPRASLAVGSLGCLAAVALASVVGSRRRRPAPPGAHVPPVCEPPDGCRQERPDGRRRARINDSGH